MTQIVTAALYEAKTALDSLLQNEKEIANIAKAGEWLANAFKSGNRAYSCGNGGSHCDAMHFAEELTGRFRGERPAYPAMAISDPAHLSCTANDYGFDRVFSRFIEAHGRAGDILLAISTSGKSPNILRAAETAKSLGVKVIALTGKHDSELQKSADLCIVTAGGRYADRVQELHIKVIHILIELVEHHMSPCK